MIYLVSNEIDPANIPDTEKMSVEDSISMIKSWPVVQFDTETTGLDPHISRLTSLQFGYKDFATEECTQIVVDCRNIDVSLYKECIESSYIIGHNLKFDLKFLYNYDIHPLNVYDTMIVEQLLYLGYKPGRVSMKLGDVLYRYTGQEIDKAYQKVISYSGLTSQGILYSAQDVRYLQDIRKGQITVGQSRKCLNAFTVENRCVPAIAYLEWCGIHLATG